MFLATLVVFILNGFAVQGLTITYCSSQNTGASFAPVNNPYQSDGACYDTCLAGYAFAILQGSNCWCSNYIPEDTTSISSCDSQCPGFPSDTCGNQALNLFGYISLTISPSGTLDTSAPTVAPVSSPSTLPASPTITPAPSTTIIPTTSWDTTPYASVVTITGLVQTVTITPTAPAVASITVQAKSTAPGGFFSDTGKVVGVFVLVAVIIVGAVFSFIWCFCCRGRDRHGTSIEDNVEPSTLSRRSSRFSQLGFSVKRRTGDWGDLPTISTAGLNNTNSNEKSPVDTITPNSRRASTNRLTIVDQRLDPDRIMHADDEHGRVGSIRSFRDDRDYSRRMLRVANPDGE